MTHYKTHNVIELTFKLLKKIWVVLRSPTFYDIRTQNRIIMACVLLHNLICRELDVDPLESEFDDDSGYYD
ncbi:hypothetical protein PHJA_001394900 [Phtheirospermum japonicum]|uniref:DDE Tnp4 domain-containing protein n=1 Tax=Phtheirospermum japonicum TaxID=374723 RepID=A0A830BWP9_9LAMI|nr:hypothetical protein PHJA_001394900 [Phtheirospermum japonicum]